MLSFLRKAQKKKYKENVARIDNENVAFPVMAERDS